MILNYYEILSLTYDASMEDVVGAYKKKMSNCQNDIMEERYRTAYYYLSNPKRRHKYDVSIGIHKYKRVSLYRRVINKIGRCILTIIDALMTFWWCFIFVMAVYGVVVSYVINENIDIFWIWNRYPDEIVILFLCSLINLLLHFYVRRANRYLKHQNWEVVDEYENKEDD